MPPENPPPVSLPDDFDVAAVFGENAIALIVVYTDGAKLRLSARTAQAHTPDERTEILQAAGLLEAQARAIRQFYSDHGAMQ